MMRAIPIFLLCTFSITSALDIFIDSPVLVLDCRSPSQDGQFVDGSTAKLDVSEEPVENITKIDAVEDQGESTTKSQIIEESIDPKEFYDAASYGVLPFINTAISQMSTKDLDLNWRNTDHDGYTALHIATQKVRPSIVTALLNAGADPDVQDNAGRTPIYIAAWDNYISALPLLLDPKYQADVNLQDNSDWTPVHGAAFWGNTAALELLLEHGGDPNKVKWDGTSPLLSASMRGHVEAVRLLIQAGAHINYVHPNTGETALHLAVWKSKTDIVLLLLQNGADKDKQDKYGNTPADEARDRGYDSVAQFIDNYSA